LFDPVWIKSIVKAVVLPPGGPLLIAFAGLIAGRRWPRAGRALVATGLLSLVLLSMPVVAWLLLRSVEIAGPVTLDEVRTAQAIVIPGGGSRRNALEYGGDTLARLTLERVRFGAWLARQTGLPVLVSGGSVSGGTPEAMLMRDALESEFAQPVRWLDAESRNTLENAQRSAALLREAGVNRIALVMHGFDMRRAAAEFEQAGLAVVPAPTGLAPEGPDTVLDFLPSMAGLQGSYYALYEILGNAVRVLDR
jgi:uncharacterized SAM-binding protein YcdF (DUF218 family)